MNRLFTIFCLVSILVFHTSCNESVLDFESSSVEMKTRVAVQRVPNLIQQAREGDVEAYYSLALCYRDGDGVEQSWLNMICMYAIYCQKIGSDIDDIIELFEEGNPFRLIFETVEMPYSDAEIEAKIDQLRQSAPAEAKAVEAARNAFSLEDATYALNTIREAEAEGSELAVIFQAAYYDRATDKTGQEEYLTRIAEKYPFFYQQLGALHSVKYRDDKDFSHIKKAIECYRKADEYGMLGRRYANEFLGLYEYFGNKGMLECDKNEMKRLDNIIKIKQ